MTTLLSHHIKQEARRLGFDHCRIIPVGEAPHADFFDAWISAGRAGEMHYLERNLDKRRHPQQLLDHAAHSLIVLAANHHQFDLPPTVRDDPSRGLIASYAWGDDYHEIIRPLLYELDAYICAQTGRSTPGKCLVDTGPVLERDWAMQSGLGFTGKNCCTIDPMEGSWLLLATIVVPEVLAEVDDEQNVLTLAKAGKLVTAADVLAGLVANEDYGAWVAEQQSATQRTPLLTCGRCTRCLDACPTNAFVGPFHLDPQRCISYWTIEAAFPIPRQLRARFGNRIFGCDICQEICPWNQRLAERKPLLTGLLAQSERVAPPLLAGFSPDHPYWLDQTAFSQHFRRSPIKRAKRQGMLRNVCVALGNWGAPESVPALQIALGDPSSLVRGHAAWALGEVLRKHQYQDPHQALLLAQQTENDNWVQEEINLALND